MIIIDIVPSNDNKHKYTAYIKNDNDHINKVKFGAIDYNHYYDLLKYYRKLNHLDTNRRNNYYSRHSIDYPKYSPDWFSKKILWPLTIKDTSKESIIKFLNNI
jgi:hypothetical protein